MTSIATHLAICESDIVLSALPLSFEYGLDQALMTLKAGATLVLENSFTIPMILNRIAAVLVTGLPLVPAMAAVLLLEALEPGNFPHLRYVTISGPVVTPAHVARLQELFSSARLYSMYGLGPSRPGGERERFRLPKQVEFDQERPRPAPVLALGTGRHRAERIGTSRGNGRHGADEQDHHLGRAGDDFISAAVIALPSACSAGSARS